MRIETRVIKVSYNDIVKFLPQAKTINGLWKYIRDMNATGNYGDKIDEPLYDLTDTEGSGVDDYESAKQICKVYADQQKNPGRKYEVVNELHISI